MGKPWLSWDNQQFVSHRKVHEHCVAVQYGRHSVSQVLVCLCFRKFESSPPRTADTYSAGLTLVWNCKMHKNTSLLVRCATDLTVWYEHALPLASLCCQICPTTLSCRPCAECYAPFQSSSLMCCHTGRFFLSISRSLRSTAAWCTSWSSDSGIDHWLVIIFHSMHWMRTSTIWLLELDTWASQCNRVPRGAQSMAALRNSTGITQDITSIIWSISGYPRISLVQQGHWPSMAGRAWGKTCVYHDILSYFGISMIIFKFETFNHVKLGYLILNMYIPIW